MARGAGGVMKLIALCLVLTAAVFSSLFFGSVSIAPGEVIAALRGSADAGLVMIVQEIRLPRSLLAVLVGAGIATSGAALQGLFRNPLADPALIGVSAGAALFAALFVVVGAGVAGAVIGMAGSAFVGGLLATWVVLLVGERGGGLSTMLLAGIAINAIALAGVGLLSYLSSDVQLRSISFWALGSLNGASWQSVMVALIIPFVVVVLVRQAHALDVVTLGDDEAEHLGISHRSLRHRVVLLSALAVGVGVALTGVIAFIGLIVPHLVRAAFGAGHRRVLPASALLGGLFLLIADVFSRTLLGPAELPIGILTALIGGPFFLYLMISRGSERQVL